jgi:hypothetical protein
LVGFAASNGTDVDDVAATAVGAGLKDGKDRLRHANEAGYVGCEHDVDVFGFDVGGLVQTFYETAVHFPMLVL